VRLVAIHADSDITSAPHHTPPRTPGVDSLGEIFEEVAMGRLIRLDRSGHTTLAEWMAGDASDEERAAAAFRAELERGMVASVSYDDGTAEVVRELPLDAELVVLRRPIAGG
jgi:hypothetical protein